MPMFQVDGGRSVAVHPLQPARTAFGSDASSMVADHLDTLLGEHLLPLRIRQGDADEPYLLAVDAAGQPVVVEVVALLDEQSVMDALRHAGRAARMSTQDLARAYSGGAERFAAHLAAFRETVPATSLLSTSVRGGSRLLLVCSDLDDGMDDVVEFLLQPGAQIEVLQVGVIQGAEGARIVDVSPLVRTPPHRRAMEPTSLHLVRSSGSEPARSTGAVRAPGPTEPRSTGAPVGDVTPVPVVPVRTSALHREPATALPLVGSDDEQATRLIPAITPPPFAVVRTSPGQDLPYAFTGALPTPPRAEPHPDLVAAGARSGAATVLVWTRERRGQRYEALLHPDGFIELPDGSRHTDPCAAAAAVSGAEHVVDGWQVWHVDHPSGPTLAELAARAEA